jgi:hypothetical protein
LRPVNEADHSPISSTEVKNEWSWTYTPLYAFIAYADFTGALLSTESMRGTTSGENLGL